MIIYHPLPPHCDDHTPHRTPQHTYTTPYLATPPVPLQQCVQEEWRVSLSLCLLSLSVSYLSLSLISRPSSFLSLPYLGRLTICEHDARRPVLVERHVGHGMVVVENLPHRLHVAGLRVEPAELDDVFTFAF